MIFLFVCAGMLWFEVKGGTEAGRALMDSIQRPWSLCENLGAMESICTCPAVMTHVRSFYSYFYPLYARFSLK